MEVVPRNAVMQQARVLALEQLEICAKDATWMEKLYSDRCD